MSESSGLEQLVAVRPRFARSISLVRDFHRFEALEGYILTSSGRDVLHRLADALRDDSPTRAWSLTGPYGSGKSAFALFAAQLLGGEEAIRQQARASLPSSDRDLHELFFGSGGPLRTKAGRLCPVLVTGSRQPLDKALAASLASALRRIARTKPPQIVESLERLAGQPHPAGTAIVALFEEASEYLERSGKGVSGILLIVDELGKFLEYGAGNPEQGDVFVLQELAESATRSKRPFLFLTILHQSIDDYVGHLSPVRRAEWAKVQGRFEAVPFEERTEEVLRLLSHAIQHKGPEPERKKLHKRAKTLVRETIDLGVRVGAMAADELQERLTECYPLHPVTAVVLGPLFRQLAQNERSLFAFLASSEPFGFQDFLREHKAGEGTYRLDQLYDYVMASLGPNLFTLARGKMWAEIQSALDRLHDATDVEVRLAKTIGLLHALGAATGISAAECTLRLALKGVVSEAEIGEVIEELKRRSVIVFRRHAGSYALWEGSDVDIDDRLHAARQSVERDQSLAAFLAPEVPPQPLIARRHYFQTGTLRYFETCYADRGAFQRDLFENQLTRDFGDADGRLVLCLPGNADEREAMRNFIEAATEPPVVAALPQDLYDLRELCHELICLRWVSEHTPELEADRTARRELHARLAIAEQNLRTHLESVFSPTNTGGCMWFYQGKAVPLSSQRELNDFISHICDEVYPATPHWRNELINRRSLSSAAAAARRNLIEGMIEHAREENLGFAGTPPERSMYETLLKGSHLHRKPNGRVVGFYPPDGKAEAAVRQLWKAIDGFLDETESARKSVEELFALLRRPPFGLKNGVLPVLLAAVLVQGQAEVALYEEGSFVPRPSAAVFERIFRSPGKFEIQRFRIAGPRAKVFQQYAAMLTRIGGGEADLLGIVRPLVRFVKELPDYVGKTRQTSEIAQRILSAIKDARQPDRLLFADLPAACGFPGFEASGKVDAGQVEHYFGSLRSGFGELQRAYPNLLAEIERLIYNAFGQHSPLAKARKEIEHEALCVLNLAVDPKLKAFLMRVSEIGIEDATWLESIATLLTGKPPVHWDDHERARFEVELAAMARRFEHFRVLAFEMEQQGTVLLDGDKEMLRISISVPEGGEVERVVKLPPTLAPQAKMVQEEVRRILREANLSEQREVSVAILAQIARQLLSEGESP